MQALKGVVILMTVTIAVLMTLIVYGMYQKSQDPDFKFFDLGGGDQSAAAPQIAPQITPDATPDVTPPTGAAVPTARAFGDITLPLPAGARITAATVSGDRLVIVVAGEAQTGETQTGEQVWVVDLATGQVLGRVKAQKAP